MRKAAFIKEYLMLRLNCVVFDGVAYAVLRIELQNKRPLSTLWKAA